MMRFVFLAMMLGFFSNSTSAQIGSAATTPSGIALDRPWKMELEAFAQKNLRHPAWGYSHSERNFHQTKQILLQEGESIDEDILFAAAFLHDLGGLPPYEMEGVDHAVRSAELAPELLRQFGFPLEKIAAVQATILGHVYYKEASGDAMSRAFRDADMLDFMGPMGVARLLAATNELSGESKIKDSIQVMHKLMRTLPAKFTYERTAQEAQHRHREAEEFLANLKKYSFSEASY